MKRVLLMLAFLTPIFGDIYKDTIPRNGDFRLDYRYTPSLLDQISGIVRSYAMNVNPTNDTISMDLIIKLSSYDVGTQTQMPEKEFIYKYLRIRKDSIIKHDSSWSYQALSDSVFIYEAYSGTVNMLITANTLPFIDIYYVHMFVFEIDPHTSIFEKKSFFTLLKSDESFDLLGRSINPSIKNLGVLRLTR